MTATIGIDCGATKILALVVDGLGQVIDRRRVPTPSDATRIADTFADVVDQLRRAHPDVTAVGISAAGWVDADRSTVLTSPHLAAFDRNPLGETLAERTGLPVVLENDANAATWAEYHRGAGRGERNLVLYTLGSGVGGGIVIEGQLVRGAHGVAGEIGHTRVCVDGPPCPCGRNGCLDMYASGRGLERHYRARGGEETASGEDISRRAQAGDPVALAAYRELGRWLALSVAEIVQTLDPSVIVLGGGVADSGAILREALSEPLGEILRARSVVPSVRIVCAELGSDAGAIGAAELARVPAHARTHAA